MLDLYALPNDFPGCQESLEIKDPYQRVEFLEQSLLRDINAPQFIPYLQLHEFEALLLANPSILLLEYMDAHREVNQLLSILEQHHHNAELINTGPETAPSKRIISLIPAYRGNKVNVGAYLAGIEGVNEQQKRCKHFSGWIDKLLGLAS